MKWMVWAAIAYGILIGVAEFFVLRLLVRFALARRNSTEAPPQYPPRKMQDTPRTRLRLAAALLLYFAFAMAAVYIFTAHLIPTAIGMFLGLAGTAALRLFSGYSGKNSAAHCFPL